MLAELAILTAAALSGGSTAPVPTPCVVQQVEARCTELTVPEDRARPGGRRIRLRVVILPARARPALPDAFTYLAGGPGGAAASEMTATVASIWATVNERRDIVLVDQRGTGASNGLVCPAPTKPLDTDAQRRQYLRTCLARVPGDPRHYGTRAAMDDLEDVRVALGYEQLDVYGTSYGATAAQIYLNRHPRSVRTMVLDGGTFLDVPFYDRFARNGQRALEKITVRCARQPSCRTAFPRWRSQLHALIARWNASPAVLPDGSRITGDGLAGVVQKMSLSAERAVWIPLAVANAFDGDVTLLASFVDPVGPPRSIMFWTIMCNEPWVGLGAQGPWGTYLDGSTAGDLAGIRTVCRYLPRARQPAHDWRRPSGATPVLALTGEADPQDPASNLTGLRAAFPDSRLVVARGQGHAIGQYGCLPELTAAFIDAATTRGLDTRCATAIAAPPFRTP